MLRVSPFLRRDPRAVAPVVSTVMLVAITVVLAAVLFVMVSGMLVKPPAPPPAVTLESREWANGTYTASVTAVTGADNIPASELLYILQDSEFTPYYNEKANENATLNGITVTIRYQDLDAQDRITPGDRIQIEVTPISGKALLEGGVLQILHGGRQIANHGV